MLFGNLQKVTAEQLGLLADPDVRLQQLRRRHGQDDRRAEHRRRRVATGGHPDSPDAGTILRSVFWHSVALAVLVGLLVYAQAGGLPFTEMVVQ